MDSILVTGANRGIGLALVQHLRRSGESVVAACRHSSADLDATGARVEAGVDVTDDAALRSLADRLSGTRLRQAWLNAGILGEESLGKIDQAGFDNIRRQLEVNALGPLRVVQAMLALLDKGAKVAIITSRMGSMTDNGSGGYYGYRASKAAVNAIGKSLAVDLKPRGVAVFLMHPGYVSTEMVGGHGDITPAQSAERLVSVVDGLGMPDTGTFWHSNGSSLPW